MDSGTNILTGTDISILIEAPSKAKSVSVAQEITKSLEIQPENLPQVIDNIKAQFQPKAFCYYNKDGNVIKTFLEFVETLIGGAGFIKRIEMSTITEGIRRDRSLGKKEDFYKYASEWLHPVFAEYFG